MGKFLSQGIRISDIAYDGACIDLNDILKEVYEGGRYYWTILVFQINGYKGIDQRVLDLQDEVEKLEMGQQVSWSDLSAMGNDVFQFIELILVGSKNLENNRWIQEPKVRYETPDIYIEMFDSSYWEVFSKDHAFINRLAHKFKDIKFLDPDFLEKEKP